MIVKQSISVTKNTVRQLLADPFFLVLHLGLITLLVLLGEMPGFTYGEHTRLLRDQCQSLIFILGCLGGCFLLIRAVTDELRRGAAPELRSRPILPFVLITGKWTGCAICLLLFCVTGQSGFAWVSQVATETGEIDQLALLMLPGLVLLVLIGAAIWQGVFGGSFVLPANFAIAVAVLLGAVIRTLLGSHTDMTGVQSGVFLVPAMLIFLAILLPVAVLWDSPVVFGCGLAVFFLGLITNASVTADLSGTAGMVIGGVLPDWQLFWLTDFLADGGMITGAFVVDCVLRVLFFMLLCLPLATLLYERQEVQG